MYIKFLKHGMGAPAKAASYLISDIDHLGYKRAGVETLRGDAQTFVAIASSLSFKHRYTSGVIAWSKEDAPTDKQINETLDAFEHHAFAGLDPTRYHMNAVLHVSDDGSKHVHVLIPKVDLATGKSLNIAPPGHEKYFDKLRDYLNEKHQWSKPDQIAILNAAAPLPDDLKDQSLSDLHAPLPNHIHAQRAAAKKLNFLGMKKDDQRELLYQSVKVLVDAGLVCDRKDVVHFLGDYGAITKQRKDYISIKLDGEKTTIRLTGDFFKDGFTYTAFRQAGERAAADQRSSSLYGVNADRCEKLLKYLQKAADARADFHARRYAVTASRTEQPSGAGLQHPAHSFTGSDPSSNQSLSGVKDPSFRGAGLGYGGTENQFDPSRTAKGELKHSAAVGRTAKNEPDPSRTGGRVEGQTAASFSFVSIMSGLDGSPDLNFIGEVNERIRTINEAASQPSAEASGAAGRGLDAINQLQLTVSRTKRAFDAGEQGEIGLDYNAERRVIKSQTQAAIGRATEGLQQNFQSYFTAAVTSCFDAEKHSIDERINHLQSGGKPALTLHQATFSDDFGSFSTDFGSLRHGFKQFHRDRSQQAGWATTRANDFSYHLGRTLESIDGLNRRIAITDYFKPRPCTEMTEYFRNYSYKYKGGADRLHEWSESQNKALKERNTPAILSAIQGKYDKVSDLVRQNTLEAYEIELFQRMVANDKRLIEELKSYTHVSREDQNRFKQIFSIEQTANADRLSKLQEQESVEQPTFEPKSDPTPSKPTKENTRTYDSPSPSPFD